jgi:hypothetical protein
MALISNYSDFLASFRSSKFKKLRPAQGHILDQYSAYEPKPDVAIELPTGAGKTLIALLIAEAWRRNGNKAAILSANKTLARQMQQEAEALKIPSVLMEGRRADIPAADIRAYQRFQKIAIMNYWVYFNQNPAIDPADLLVMDDAHLAEHCLHSLFSVQIGRHSHEALFKTIVAEVLERFPEYSVLADALAPSFSTSGTPPELLSFFDQDVIADRVRDIVDTSPAIKTDTDLAFRWKRIRNSLREANFYFGVDQIWIRPYIYPLIGFSHYQETKQRLYVSATIGDPGDLSRRLGVRPIVKIPVDPVHSQKTAGRRLVVMNRFDEQESDIPHRLEVALLTVLKIHPKSVWLCSSQAEAEKFRGVVSQWLNANGLVGHPAWVLTALGDEIDQFKASGKGHLFVGGRFDGMDFRGDECRLVVLTTLPRAINAQEEFISAYLRDAGFMRRRLNQRIVQALGRCNREDSDFGVYVLADKRFATHFGRDANRESVPPNMMAEIDMAQDLAEVSEKELCKQIRAFLEQDFSKYDAELQKYKEMLPTPKPVPALVDTSANEVVGWAALFSNQNYDLAADRFEECWTACETGNLVEIGAFWKWNWAKAVFLQSVLGDTVARAKAFELAEQAIKRGGISSWFNRLRASLNRARASRAATTQPRVNEYAAALIRSFDDHLEKVGATGQKFDLFCQRISAGLNSEKHEEYCEGLEKLGSLLGYQAARPKYKAATDTRWRGTFGNSKELITFEAKVEHSAGTEITPTHMGQAHNQLNRAITEFEQLGYSTRGTIVTHLTAIEAAAKSSAGAIRIVTKSGILELWERVRLLLSVYRQGWSIDDVPARQSAANAIVAKCPHTGWLLKALDEDRLFLDGKHMLSGWSK